MRKILTIGLCILSILFVYGATAYAGEKSCDSYFWGKVANECSPHTVDTDTDTHAKQRDQAGVGADVVIWQNETEKAKMIEEVVAEYKYDIDNEAHSIYGVVRVNLWQKIKGLFSRD
jgi:hypothetical protein